MLSRLTFLGIAGFWLTMNGLLWRSEFGSNPDDFPVPVDMVVRKILTAPDTSSLSVYAQRQRMGYCEFSTSVGQQMAALDDNHPPPEGLVARAGYQLHLTGNVALINFTNRIKFDGRLTFLPTRQWQELQLRLTTSTGVIEIHSAATNRSISLRFTADGAVFERQLPFADLADPAAALRLLGGDWGGMAANELPFSHLATTTGPAITWTAHRTRLRMGTETAPVYRLETDVLGRTITLDVSPLGEILRASVPDVLEARIDELNRP